ncbi:MAG: hypothetical protein MR350_05455 [Alphaproteobacteria bacterium]|nr:hypothetical protein [Alphaproteobacteria bacterium]
MDGFFGWFLIIVGVLAIFNAEKLPALRQMLEEKFKDSVDAAKAGSKTMKDKIEKVKTDIDNRKNAPQAEKEAEENTPEETEEALQFMSSYISKEEDKESAAKENAQAADELSAQETTDEEKVEETEEKTIDLNHFD